MSALSRSGRRWLAGVPVHAVINRRLSLDRFKAALSSVRFASVEMRDALRLLPSHAPSAVVPALAHSASTLTALHGLALTGLEYRRLTAFTQLRVLTLCGTEGFGGLLRAEHLPASLEDLTLRLSVDYGTFEGPDDSTDEALDESTYRAMPAFIGFNSLCRLRRITLFRYDRWHLATWDDEEKEMSPVQLPPSLAVRACEVDDGAP